jgi:DNA polymerase III delta prime subunit
VSEFLDIPDAPKLDGWPVEPVPETSDLPSKPIIIPAAVLGLFQLRFQSAIDDYKNLMELEDRPGTLSPFLSLDHSLVAGEMDLEDSDLVTQKDVRIELPDTKNEHLIDRADPCQRRAVLQARQSRGLIVHGPPGTGKSQTILNIIGDHLARGERVLLVCEKRTALDVVKLRLAAKGLDHLCAVVHDATHDRYDLYKSIRDDLETLAESANHPDPTRELDNVNDEMRRVFNSLTKYFDGLTETDDATGLNFHDLAGCWYSALLEADLVTVGELSPLLETVPFEKVTTREDDLKRTYERLLTANYNANSWAGLVGLSIDAYFQKSTDEWATVFGKIKALARAADLRIPVSSEGFIPFQFSSGVEEQGVWREKVAGILADLKDAPSALKRLVLGLPEAKLKGLRGAIQQALPMRKLAESKPLAPDLLLAFNADKLNEREVTQALKTLTSYLSECQGLLGFFKFGLKRDMRKLLGRLGRTLSNENVTEVREFFQGVQARDVLKDALHGTLDPEELTVPQSDAELVAQFVQVQGLVDFLYELENEPLAEPLKDKLRMVMTHPDMCEQVVLQFENATQQASAIKSCQNAIERFSLFNDVGQVSLREQLFSGQPMEGTIDAFVEDFRYLEQLIRYQDEIAEFQSEPLDEALRQQAGKSIPGAQAFVNIFVPLYHGAIKRRLQDYPQLLRLDPQAIDHAFDRLAELTKKKATLEVDRIKHTWQVKQKELLLAGTGSRLNSTASELKRRLLLRGKNALRLRQMIYRGQEIEGDDPLFTMRPVWMASPETVSQIFPIKSLFDIVVFDEASQCRLEEALPVLTRGKRLLVAGDTRQLPPTRFFESAVIGNDSNLPDGDDVDEDALFAAQQSETEDLLTAALMLESEQSFLDVHYRSKNEELIGFSNQAFYNGRLQAVPAHPDKRPPYPGIRLFHADGVYKKSENPKEAEFVVQHVHELLNQEEPPSVGIATFNIKQKDLIEDKLYELAEADEDFAAKLSTARNRERDGEFEGLFVKNLENVQGDERDVILISTTYGPNDEGKFYRRFGPLAQKGGERRLNVVITRARHEVHLITSIPSSEYHALAETAAPDGTSVNGGIYLMQYLCFAEELASQYQALKAAGINAAPAAESAGDELRRNQIQSPSIFVETLTNKLMDTAKLNGAQYYGGDGFCVDAALKADDDGGSPTAPRRVGLLVDCNRYHRAQDRVEWESFKQGVLNWVGWELHHIWTPHFIRQPDDYIAGILNKVQSDLPKNEVE